MLIIRILIIIILAYIKIYTTIYCDYCRFEKHYYYLYIDLTSSPYIIQIERISNLCIETYNIHNYIILY